MIHTKIPKIFFRADGNEKIGLGHITRSSALASTINGDYDCILATRCKISQVLEEVSCIYSHIVQLPETDFYSEATRASDIFENADLIILDGYSFDARYQQELLKQEFDFFSIDDIHASPFFSRIIINHSGGITPFNYKAQPATQFYLGPSYSLLRRPFLEAAKKRRNKINNKNCFVCFGGADPENKTLEILRSDNIRNHFEQFHVVTGSAYKYEEELRKFVDSGENIFLYSSLSSEEMVSLMEQCCFAICSPSTIVYEFMSVGGVVFLEQIAGNQEHVIQYMTEEGLAFLINDIGNIEENSIKLSLEKQSLFFDGRSDERFGKIFRQHFYGKNMIIRRAGDTDLQICFNWANDKVVREQSYNQNPIGFDEHTEWFRQKLSDTGVFFYIIEMDGEPIAQIRFQISGGEAVLGYLADEKSRNKGLGTAILSKGIEKFVNDYRNPIQIVGYVKNSNYPSQHSFDKLAFVKTKSTKYSDSFKYTMYYDN
jgi:UDP-2,4-diacetamido-2,4,6-trideoxy-beta-L-altropyranose hydrolase